MGDEREGGADAANPRSLDEAFWEGIAGRSPELADNAEGAQHLAFRFAGKYLPALHRARSREESERVWLAFWSYLVARATDRKPFGLSQGAADEVIARFQGALDERRGLPRP